LKNNKNIEVKSSAYFRFAASGAFPEKGFTAFFLRFLR